MPPVTLRLKETPEVPLEAESISPDALAEASHHEIAALPVYLGKRRMRLDELFEIEGGRSDDVRLYGDCGRVKLLGRGMTRGKLTVYGNAGMHVGAYMKGGEIEVFGDAGDWIGAEMKNGLIRVHGNGGGQIGAAYRGSLAGMKNGTILIAGTAGLEIGMRMRRGTIVIGGPAKDFVGLQMKGGTIVLMQGAEIRTGAWMVRGTILSLAPLPMLPTFAYACSYNPSFVNVYARKLAKLGVNVPLAGPAGNYEMYSGDAAVPGKGEILIWRPRAAL